MPKVVICDAIADEGVELLRDRAEVVLVAGCGRDRLIAELAEADGAIVRSATELDAELLAAAPNLRVIARAGVGVDNVDLDCATRRGIAVVNTPTGNTIAAAEHAMAMMLALARRIPAASAALKEGRWLKKEATGRQLYRKTLGIVGLGKIGQEVARRARAFGMTLVACDPFVPADSARELGVEPVEMDELLSRSDVITLHAALTEQTRQMIGAEQLARMKPGALLVNCARGALVDEDALIAALTSGHLGGAGLDVFENEPEPRADLVGLPNVVATPHVAASTEEAQALVAREAAEQVLEVLEGGRPRWPVNVPALTREEMDAIGPFLPLAEALGRLQAALLTDAPRSAAIYVRGGGAEEHLDIISGHFLSGMLGELFDEPVNYVNAPVLAAERGLQMSSGVAADTRGYSRYIRVSISDGGGPTEVAGALLDRGQARIVEIAGFGLDLVPADTVLLCWNARPDRPGFIGTIGRILGEAGISILGIQVGREIVDGAGLMAVSVAGEVAPEVRAEITGQPAVTRLEIVRFN